MPMSFPDMDSLKSHAIARNFRQPKEGETEAEYRSKLSAFIAVRGDKVEAGEIATGKGWSQQSPQSVLSAFARPNGPDTYQYTLKLVDLDALPSNLVTGAYLGKTPAGDHRIFFSELYEDENDKYKRFHAGDAVLPPIEIPTIETHVICRPKNVYYECSLSIGGNVIRGIRIEDCMMIHKHADGELQVQSPTERVFALIEIYAVEPAEIVNINIRAKNAL